MITQEEKLLFLHIPKTAGITLQHVIAQNYGQEDIFKIEGPKTSELFEEFKTFPEAKRNKYRVIAGHMPFGIHEYLAQPYSYVTILRDPIDRIVSAYYYVLGLKDHPMHRNLVESGMGLRECVKNGMPPVRDNEHIRFIAGLDSISKVPYGAVSQEHLELAKKNLKTYFAVVGISEEFDKTLLLTAKKFGWKHLFYKRQNITSKRPTLQQLDQSTLRVIEEYNHLDMELYEFGRGIFNELIKSYGPKFNSDLNSLHRNNKIRKPHSKKKNFGIWKDIVPWRIQKVVNRLLRG